MIFVTVGTYKFDSLVKEMDQIASQIGDKVVIQIANGSYIPVHCEFFKTTNYIKSYFEKADLVVSHGGTGTILELLALNKSIIGVANAGLKDNHQHEFLKLMENKGALKYCRDITQLKDFVVRQKNEKPSSGYDLFFKRIVSDIEGLDCGQIKNKNGMVRKICTMIPYRLQDITLGVERYL